MAANSARIAMTQPIERRRRSASSAFAALPTCALRLLALALLALPQGATRAQAQAQPDKVIAKVQGVELRESDLAMAEEDMGQQAQQLQGDAKRDALVGYLADVIIVSKAAEAKKVTEQKDFKSRIAFIRNKLAMEMLLVEEGKATASSSVVVAAALVAMEVDTMLMVVSDTMATATTRATMEPVVLVDHMTEASVVGEVVVAGTTAGLINIKSWGRSLCQPNCVFTGSDTSPFFILNAASANSGTICALPK